MGMTNFEKAFAAARKAGKKEFSWNGGKYNTKLADSPKVAKTPKTAPIPTARPMRGEATTQRNVPVPPKAKSTTPPVPAGYRKPGAKVNFLPSTQTNKLSAPAAPAKEESWRDKFKKQNQDMGMRKKYSRT